NKESEEFELAQALLSKERFWDAYQVERGGRTKTEVKYRFNAARHFLYNRGFGIDFHQPNEHRFTIIDDMVVKEVDQHYIRRYMISFLENISEWEPLEMLLRAGHQYLGPMQLANLWERKHDFNKPDKSCMYFYFESKYWKITADGIEERPIKDLPKPIWSDQIIKFDPNLLDDPLIELDRQNGKWIETSRSEAANRCEMFRFYDYTSNFHWRKVYELKRVDGIEQYVKKPVSDLILKEDQDKHLESLARKILACGYMLHEYIDYSNTKMVVCMDGKESEVGRSEGGTGKSIFIKQWGKVHVSFLIDGMGPKIDEDKHVLEGVDDKTGSIVIDDADINFPTKWIFSKLTTGITVNPKGTKARKYAPKKMALTTNHALRGEGNSFERRQYIITFSDYFNGNRTPNDEFGHQLFHEWDWEQWNYFYNLMATCVQHFLRHGLVAANDKQGVLRRRMRQAIGESLVTFLNRVYNKGKENPGCYLNRRVERKYLYNQYCEENKRDARYLDMKKFTDKLKRYCKYADLEYNAHKNGGYVKTGNKYYHVVTDENFTQQMLVPAIHSDLDLDKWQEVHSLPI
ncbi:MAG: hypothetical protein AAFR59_04255, partial [Bacteroidota bacterium]